jgi:hypothetical protein
MAAVSIAPLIDRPPIYSQLLPHRAEPQCHCLWPRFRTLKPPRPIVSQSGYSTSALVRSSLLTPIRSVAVSTAPTCCCCFFSLFCVCRAADADRYTGCLPCSCRRRNTWMAWLCLCTPSNFTNYVILRPTSGTGLRPCS